MNLLRLLIGTDESVICVDYSSRSVLINLAITELYNLSEPFFRGKNSPKKNMTKFNTVDQGDETNATSSNEHFITRQFTLDMASRSSSNSSLENLPASEGICFIAINQNSSQNSTTDSNSKFNQIWLGTSYGSVIVLNSVSSVNVANDNNEMDSISKNENIKSTVLNPTGIHLKLKGQIIDVAFLDMNGILLTPVNTNINQSIASRHTTKQIETDLEDLDIDFDYTTGMFSNSIADNFFGGPAGGSVSSSNNEQNVDTNSGSSSSANTTPTGSSFVNPFATQQSQEDTKESKENPKDSKMFLKNSKSNLSLIITNFW